ncbi:uncharacterized protein LOC132644139 [Lycium barbarum]|uniref:uncharacterized protein LOC132644139 n=1 Tax=Lycium barbarum TaxID=112863 RepID=UPI00293EAE81|nr:uncharacterized protein LOC132644139 [Lycium barbarum]
MILERMHEAEWADAGEIRGLFCFCNNGGDESQQHDVDATSAEKLVAERRSKKIHDPARIRNPSTMQVDTEVQGQLFRCFMVRELKRSNSDAFVIDINGTELTFGLFEFALITGLKCYGDEVVFDEGPNRLLDEYFGGSDKDWGVGDNADEDAVKIAILYFIHTYILSSEKRNVTVPRHHFDLVESEQYNEYTWGKEAFDDLIKSIHHKMDKPKQFYCLRGFPFAMQVWIYECCSNVDPNLMVKTGSRIPRMLNWRTVNQKPSVNYLMLGMFKDGEDNCCKFNNIVPTMLEVEKLGLRAYLVNRLAPPPQTHQEEENEYADFSTTPPHISQFNQRKKKRLLQVSTAFLLTSVPVDDVSTSKSIDLTSLRQELNQFKQEVFAEFKVVFTKLKVVSTEIKDLRKIIDKNFEKDDDSETQDPLHDGNIHQQAGDYMDHGDDIHMETDTGDVHPTEEKGLAPDIQVGIGNDSGDTLKASTEEITEGGDLSGEPKTSVERSADPTEEKGLAPDIQVDIGNESGDTMEASTEEIAEGGDISGEPKTSVERSGKHTVEEQKCSDDSNNSEMIAQVLANIAESVMTNEQFHAEKTEENTSSTVLEEPQAAVCNAQPLSQWLLPDEYLPSQTPGKEIMLHPSVTRATHPSKYKSSPFVVVRGKDHVHVFDKKYPFQIDPITGPLDVQMVDEYRTWLRNGLLVRHNSKKNYEDHYKKKAVFDNGVKYNFGITTVNDKNWFYLLSMDGQLWNDERAIFQDIRTLTSFSITFGRKESMIKGTVSASPLLTAYSSRELMWSTTHIAMFETQKNVANEDQVLIEYVKGHRLIANVPWHTVDNMLIPVNIQEENHWRLYVYNSYQSAGHNAVVRNEIKKLATLLPHFLHLAGFYVNQKSIDLVKDPTYADKGQIDILEVVYVDNLPHQTVGSTDCGVFVAAYAEYLTSGERIPDVIDANMQRMRYGALLWDYAKGKVADNAESDNEVPPRPIRPAIDYDTVDAIDV